jgi:hypothetical protein
MHKILSPLTYICECGKKMVFSDVDANTTRRCDCGRTIVVQQQAVYSPTNTGAKRSAVASASEP